MEKIPEGYGLLNWEGFLQGGKALRGEYRAAEQGERIAAIACGAAISNDEFIRGGSPAEIARLHSELMSGSYRKLEL